nr:MAG TPA: L SHAPED TAIL FIBER PROTEIN [Caudoviricetes sp.]
MAIQMRRGAYAEFDPLKMKAGEWAVSTDSDMKKQQIWMCFAPGIVKRMGTVEDFDTEIQRLIQNYLDSMAQSVSQAQKSAELATSKAQESANSASNANASEIRAKASETNAKTSETSSAKSESEAQKYAEQVKKMSESFSGALRPLGTINFADLPSTADASSGDMYNIADQFTTTTDFKEGAGNIIPAGSNVYLTIDRYWDVLAGTPVTGVKGAKETYYRRGNVNITPTNIGAVAKDGNISDTTVTFADTTTRENLVSDEKVSAGFGKIKKWFADLKSFVFKDLVNNLTTTTTGSALDASQGKILNDKYDELNQSLGSLSNKQNWKRIGTFRDTDEHVISNIQDYKELRVNFMLYYSGNSYITREYVFSVSESNGLELLFLDGNYYDSNNYTSWCIAYNPARNGVQNRSSWLRSVVLGKDTTCQCVYSVFGR